MNYGRYRSGLIGAIMEHRLTPLDVAERLLKAQREYPEIDALEIEHLRDLGARWDGTRPPEPPPADDDQPSEDLWASSTA